MHHLWIRVCVIALASALLAPALLATDSVAVAERAPAVVSVAACAGSDQSDNHSARFEGEMQTIPQAVRMEMRFRLLERLDRRTYVPVKAPRLGVWRTSRPGVRRFAYTQSVIGLHEGASYRAVVHFRWYGQRGELVRSAAVRSAPCVQPGGPPDLQILPRMTARAAPVPGKAVYSLRVLNAGGSMARSFGVTLAVDSAGLVAPAIEGLGAHESRAVEFTGPLCRGSVRAAVDPDNVVTEPTEDNNVRSWPCPALVQG